MSLFSRTGLPSCPLLCLGQAERARTGLASPSGCSQRGWVEFCLGEAAAPSFLGSLESVACHPAEGTSAFPSLALGRGWLVRAKGREQSPWTSAERSTNSSPCGKHCCITSFPDLCLGPVYLQLPQYTSCRPGAWESPSLPLPLSVCSLHLRAGGPFAVPGWQEP